MKRLKYFWLVGVLAVNVAPAEPCRTSVVGKSNAVLVALFKEREALLDGSLRTYHRAFSGFLGDQDAILSTETTDAVEAFASRELAKVLSERDFTRTLGLSTEKLNYRRIHALRESYRLLLALADDLDGDELVPLAFDLFPSLNRLIANQKIPPEIRLFLGEYQSAIELRESLPSPLLRTLVEYLTIVYEK